MAGIHGGSVGSGGGVAGVHGVGVAPGRVGGFGAGVGVVLGHEPAGGGSTTHQKRHGQHPG